MKKLISLIVVLLIAGWAHAQMANPVKFSTQLKTNGTAEAEIQDGNRPRRPQEARLRGG